MNIGTHRKGLNFFLGKEKRAKSVFLMEKVTRDEKDFFFKTSNIRFQGTYPTRNAQKRGGGEIKKEVGGEQKSNHTSF